MIRCLTLLVNKVPITRNTKIDLRMCFTQTSVTNVALLPEQHSLQEMGRLVLCTRETHTEASSELRIGKLSASLMQQHWGRIVDGLCTCRRVVECIERVAEIRWKMYAWRTRASALCLMRQNTRRQSNGSLRTHRSLSLSGGPAKVNSVGSSHERGRVPSADGSDG